MAEGFAKHFQSVYNTFSPVGYYSGILSNDFFYLSPIPDLHILHAIKGLGPSQSVALYGIPGFIIKGCSTIFAPLLKYIIDFNLSKEHFPIQWIAVVVPISKEGNISSVSNYRQIYLFNNCSIVFIFYKRSHVKLFQT